MKIKFCIFYFFLFKGILFFGQAPDIEWEKNFGGTNDDRSGSIIALADSGFLISGYSRSNDGDITLNHGGSDYWIIKLDSLGVKQWEKSFGGSETDYGGEIIELNDGYLITGVSISTDGDITENQNQPGQ